MTELSTTALFIIILIMTMLSAYFSSSETAMVALNRYRLRHLVKEGHKGAIKADALLTRPDRLLGIILIGNNLVNFSAASVATVLGLKLLGDTGVVLAPIFLTLFFLVFAEVGPKTIAAQRPEAIAFRSAYVLTPMLKYMHPGVAFINSLSNLLVRPFMRAEDQDENDGLTLKELRTVVNEGLDTPGRRRNIMLRVLDLEEVTVEDVMVPRGEIIGLDIEDDIDELITAMSMSQHTRMPVYKQNINNIMGVMHLRRATRFINHEAVNKAQLLALANEPYYVPEGTPLHTQLFNFQKQKQRIALVVDEYGDIQGIVTLEDILEEIVGEFTTDFAAHMPDISPQQDGAYLVDGLALVREVNRALDWTLPEDGPKTLNGLVLEHLETIPENNLCLRISGFEFETVQINDNVIRTLKVRPAARSGKISKTERPITPS
ncbi:MAG: HlyC/CorC family transporter [Pseudomonadales bacterium]